MDEYLVLSSVESDVSATNLATLLATWPKSSSGYHITLIIFQTVL